MPELIETTRRKVRHVPAPAWEVGEGTPDVIPGSHYPDDYAGKVLAVLPAGDESDPGGAADATLDVTDEQLAGLRSRALKVVDGAPLPVTFDDRWGAAADLIRAEFVDAEQDALAADGAPMLPQPTTLMSVPTRGFDEVAALAKRSLPRNAAHTGTRYYATKAAPTKVDDTQDGAIITNLCLWSEEFDNAWWVKNLVTVTANQAVSPRGDLTADRTVCAAGASYLRTPTRAVVASQQYTYSFYAKNNGGSAASYRIWDVSNAAEITTASYFSSINNNTWVRITVIFTTPVGCINIYCYSHYVDEGSDLFLWGAQLELGASASFYIVTDAATRSGIDLVTGGLGTANAFKGGYVNNMTQVEIRAIVSHTDGSIALEGNLINWSDVDDLDIYDAEATIQGSLNQLWIDQGVAIFTASQYVRVFAGTYDENVVPNAGFVPDITNGYLLVVEGDPADDRENIKLDPAAGLAINASCDQIRVRHMWIDVTSNSNCLYTTGTCFITEVLDCKLTGVASAGTVRAANGARIEDCEMTLSGDGRAYYSANSACIIKSCKITGPGKAGSAKAALRVDKNYAISPTTVEGSVISGFEYGVEIADNAANGVRLLNTTFHDCTAVIKSVKATCSPQEVVNCIFKDCTYNFWVPTWPEETATRTGPAFIQRNNCYHGYTSFAYDGAVTKTYAEWNAYAQVDASGELDATDPELVDPSNGDFSLEPTSPCRHAGHGSGVPYDYTSFDGSAGNEFHPNTPDIGAWSGEDSVSAVAWPATLPQTVDQPTFVESLADIVERSEMDSGPAKVRRRFTSGIQVFQATVTVTIAQAATLQTFFDTTTMGGSLEFEWAHPRTGATARMRFLAPPQLTPRGPAFYVASLALEILP